MEVHPGLEKVIGISYDPSGVGILLKDLGDSYVSGIHRGPRLVWKGKLAGHEFRSNRDRRKPCRIRVLKNYAFLCHSIEIRRPAGNDIPEGPFTLVVMANVVLPDAIQNNYDETILRHELGNSCMNFKHF